MTRLWVGGTPDAVTTATGPAFRVEKSSAMVRQVFAVSEQRCTVYLSEIGNDRQTDLLDVAGQPTDQVVADDNGQIPRFQLPEGLRVDGVWLDPDDDSTARFYLPVVLGATAVDQAATAAATAAVAGGLGPGAAQAVSDALTAGGVLTASKAPELARNRATNPQLKGGVTDNPSATSFALSQITAGLPAGFAFGVKSIRQGTNSTGVADLYLAAVAGAAGTAIAVTPGEKINVAVQVWCNDPVTGGSLVARLRLRFYSSSDALVSTVDVANSALAASTWSTRKNENATVPATATHVVPELIVTAVGATSTTGSETRATGVQVTTGATAAATYGDGASPLWQWTGTPHASQSVQVFRSAADQNAAQAEVGQAAAVQAKIYTSEIIGKNLYNPAGPGVEDDVLPSGSTAASRNPSPGYRITGLVGPFNPGDRVAVSAHRFYWWTAADGTVVGTTTNTGASSATAGAGGTVPAYTVPAGATYLRVAYQYSLYPNLQIEAGTANTSYEAYNVSYALTAKMAAAVTKLAGTGGGGGGTTPSTDPLTVVAAGNTFSVSSLVDGKPLVITCGKNTSGQGSFNLDGTTHDGAAVAAISDEVTPIRTQISTVGANHGYVGGIYIATNPDGKTAADVGSRWTDGAREYVLFAVSPDGTKLMIAGSYTGGTAGTPVTVSSTLPTANLTHVGGATHTAAVDFTTVVKGSATSGFTQLVPSCFRQQVTVSVDGRPLVDGTVTGRALEVRQSYEVADYASLYDLARANVGTALSALNPEGAVLVQNVFTFRPNGLLRVRLMLDELKPTDLGICGGVQALALDQAAAGKTTTRYVPGMGTAGGLDWSAGVDMTSFPTSVDLPASAARVAGRIPAFHLDTLAAAGATSLGFAMGYLPWGNRPDSMSTGPNRATHAGTALWNMRGSTKKCYPAFTTGETHGWGHLQADAFRVYLSPAQVAAVLACRADALAAFAALDAAASVSASS